MNQSARPDIAMVMVAARASGLAVSLCTITTPPASTTFNESGAPDPVTTWPVLTGHVDIECMDAPLLTGDSVAPTEQKSTTEILGRNLRHVWLTGYYPLILNSYRATIGGIVYDIENAEADSQGQMTRMALEQVRI